MEGFDQPAPKRKNNVLAVVDDNTNYTGTQLTVHWGREHIQPLRFQGMDLGPYSMEVVVHEGETPIQAKRRAMHHMNAMAEEDLAVKLPRFVQRCKESTDNL